MQDLIQLLGGQPPRVPVVTVSRADDDPAALRAWRVLRERAFVDRLGLFEGSDLDAADTDPATVVLVATVLGEVVGGVRLHPVAGTDPALGWWQGGRLVCSPSPARGVGSALVRAACAVAEAAGVLRFEATVIEANAGLFDRLGWERVRPVEVRGAPHQLMRWPVERVAALVRATKSELGPLLADVRPGGDGWVGDDAAPVPGSDGVASVDAILPAMVARDPVWAGWCGILVGAGDLAAMGAVPRGVLGALGAPTAAHAAQVLHGLRAASDAFALPILGGHTQLGAPASLAVTALGSTSRPVPSGGGRPGHDVRLTVDLGGGWRPGYRARQCGLHLDQDPRRARRDALGGRQGSPRRGQGRQHGRPRRHPRDARRGQRVRRGARRGDGAPTGRGADGRLGHLLPRDGVAERRRAGPGLAGRWSRRHGGLRPADHRPGSAPALARRRGDHRAVRHRDRDGTGRRVSVL